MRRALMLVHLLLVGVACGRDTPPPTFPSGTVRFPTSQGHPSLSVRVADDPAARAQGLMGVESLPKDSGMAFVWDAPTQDTFWMKDTLIPLSIAFVDDQNTVITVREMTPCAQDPCETYAADGPYDLAIEANAGWFTDAGVAAGDRAILEASRA